MAKDPQPRRLGAGLQGARDLDRAGLVRALQHVRRAAREVCAPSGMAGEHRNHETPRFIHHEVPGITIPDPIMARIEAADQREQAREEGIRIAQEILLAARPLVQGVYIMPPFRRYDIAAEVIAALR